MLALALYSFKLIGCSCRILVQLRMIHLELGEIRRIHRRRHRDVKILLKRDKLLVQIVHLNLALLLRLIFHPHRLLKILILLFELIQAISDVLQQV